MDYDKNYIETSYIAEELNNMFVKDFAKFRRENNLTQTLLKMAAQYRSTVQHLTLKTLHLKEIVRLVVQAQYMYHIQAQVILTQRLI